MKKTARQDYHVIVMSESSSLDDLPRIGRLRPITPLVFRNWRKDHGGVTPPVVLYREGDCYPVTGFGVFSHSQKPSWTWFLQEAGPEDEAACPPASQEEGWQPTHYAPIFHWVTP